MIYLYEARHLTGQKLRNAKFEFLREYVNHFKNLGCRKQDDICNENKIVCKQIDTIPEIFFQPIVHDR